MMNEILLRRNKLLGENFPTFYEKPVHIVKGEGVWLYGADGKKYLDCYNNVPHVGHCHPKVVEAIAKQAKTLNTHTRYLHEGILDYGESLCSKFSKELDQLVMVCTGSEANDIALRMAQAVTGKSGFIATDNTYHGNTELVSQLSARRPPIGGYKDNIRLVPSPESINPLGGTYESQIDLFAKNISIAIDELEKDGFGFAGFMFCPIFANEGFPTVKPGFLDKTIEVIRKAGGLLLCDEVQPGFGRIGTHWWGHEWLGFEPDVVTLGKPMANGHPVGAVVTCKDVMDSFRSAFGYFNTFGGNPVSCAAASATLQVIEEESLIENAKIVGEYSLKKLNNISNHLIGDVRGNGLFFGVEFVDSTGKPATKFTARVVEEMQQHGILLNSIGRYRNTLKMRPPMPFSKENSDQAIDTLEFVLEKLT